MGNLTAPVSDASADEPNDVLVRRSLSEWVAAGWGDECLWEGWPECPTEVELTPNMIIAALDSVEPQPLSANDEDEPNDVLVRRALSEWIVAGGGDECFWEWWPKCPTEVELTPNMVVAALDLVAPAANAAKDESKPPYL